MGRHGATAHRRCTSSMSAGPSGPGWPGDVAPGRRGRHAEVASQHHLETRSTDMLQVFETAETSFRLSDGQGRDVGWIRGTAFGFGGFATEKDAIAAVVAGSHALSAYLARTFGQLATPADPS